jgi:hypothetical protein
MRYIEHCAIVWLVFTENTHTAKTELRYFLDFIGNLRRAQGERDRLELGPHFPLDIERLFQDNRISMSDLLSAIFWDNASNLLAE